MKVAVFSDIHSNAEAYRASLLNIAARGDVAELWCLGDVVGYGADPNECVMLTAALAGFPVPPAGDDPLGAALAVLRGKLTRLVRGNHDAAALGGDIVKDFSEDARAAAFWTRRVLSPESRQYLTKLQLTVTAGDIELVHSSPAAPAAFPYIFTMDDAAAAFAASRARVVFYGHTHQPVVLTTDGRRVTSARWGSLAAGARYLVNAGSIGQPRDGDARACYVLYDACENEVTEVRVAYDVAAAAAKIRRAGLPGWLADRLFQGT